MYIYIYVCIYIYIVSTCIYFNSENGLEHKEKLFKFNFKCKSLFL
jgi:hypothetical protein